MKSGLLWYDTRLTKEFDLVLNQAATRYQQKFGVKPNTCFVNPRDVPKAEQVHGMEIKTKATVMPDHIWIGVKE